MSNKDAEAKMSEQNQERRLLPKLRFSAFRDAGEWEFWPLKMIAKRRMLKNTDGKVVRVLTNSAEHGVVDQRDYFEKDIAIQGNLEGYYIIEKGDFVYNPRISTFAPVGPIHRNDLGTGVMSPLYTVFVFDNAENDFFAHYFKTTHWYSYLRQVSNSGARHDRMSISNDDFINMPVPLSDSKELQKIADCLSSIDTLIAAEAGKLDALKNHKKGLMQQLFPATGETTPRLRFPAFRDAREWEEKEIAAICDMKAGNFVSAADILENYRDGLYPCFGGNGLRGYTRTCSHSGKFPLIGRQGALCGNINFGIGSFQATEHAIVATPQSGVSVDWLYYALVHLNLNRFATGQAQPGLSVDLLNKLLCLAPKDEREQKKIAACLSSIDALILAQGDKIDALKAHKKGLMQQLFPVVDEVQG